MARESNVSRDHRGVPFLLPSTTPSTQSMVQRLEGLSEVPSVPPINISFNSVSGSKVQVIEAWC